MNLILYAIPFFFLFIGVELLIARMKNLSYYSFHDSIVNLNCGIGSTITGIFLKTLTIVAYIKLYQISPLKGAIPNAWWVWVLLFLGVDFFYYWFHRLAHEISFMWGSHAVHHQSEEYNLTVALRQAWYQGAFSFVFYLPLAILGFEPVMFVIISQVVTLYQFWIHTRLIHKLPAPVEFIFNTPSHHRVHHGVNPQYIDKNHAGTLIIWDRMFGTFEPEVEEPVYGVTKQVNSWNPVWLNFEYWINLCKDVWRIGFARPALLVLVKFPGWKPPELGGAVMAKPVSPKTFKKYMTEIPAGLNRYVLVQFIIMLLGSTTFLLAESKPPFSVHPEWKVVVTALIILALLNMGAIFEKKSWLPGLEFARIIITGMAFVFLTGIYSAPAVVLTGLVAVGSIIWFGQYLKEFNPKTLQQYV